MLKYLKNVFYIAAIMLYIAGCNKQTAKVDIEAEKEPVNEIESYTETKTEEKRSNVLVAYFSQEKIVNEDADAVTSATPYIGNTATVAREIQRQLNCDIFEIITEKSYPINHRECSSIAEEEIKADERPVLISHVDNMEQYDTIFVGFPIWWYQEPMAIRTFLEEYNFSGKIIVPFCTSLGVDVSKSKENISLICNDSEVLDGITIYTEKKDISNEITNWLAQINIRN